MIAIIKQEPNQGEYKCAMCGGIFEFVNDETWNDDMAKQELESRFKVPVEQCDIVCDPCFKKYGSSVN